MKKLLYGTGNPAKLAVMKAQLHSLPMEIVCLRDMEGEIPEVTEDGDNELANAEKKALAYFKAFGGPVFSCDCGLYFEEVADCDQPGMHVRTVNGRYLTDEEMLEHYIGLVRKYGPLTARYRNSVCLVKEDGTVVKAMDDSLCSEPFRLIETPHSPVRRPGYPLDSISVEISSGKYYYDLEEERLDRVATADGLVAFLKRNL